MSRRRYGITVLVWQLMTLKWPPFLLQGLMLFGRDVSKIPCFRNSFLYGIGGGFAGGLLTFMFTSRPQLSTHSAMGVFMCVTFGYWAQCR